MSDKWHGGKGDKPRPVDKEKFDAEFDRIFGKVAKEFVEEVVEEDKNQDTIDFISAKYLNTTQSYKTEDE